MFGELLQTCVGSETWAAAHGCIEISRSPASALRWWRRGWVPRLCALPPAAFPPDECFGRVEVSGVPVSGGAVQCMSTAARRVRKLAPSVRRFDLPPARATSNIIDADRLTAGLNRSGISRPGGVFECPSRCRTNLAGWIELVEGNEWQAPADRPGSFNEFVFSDASDTAAAFVRVRGDQITNEAPTHPQPADRYTRGSELPRVPLSRRQPGGRGDPLRPTRRLREIRLRSEISRARFAPLGMCTQKLGFNPDSPHRSEPFS